MASNSVEADWIIKIESLSLYRRTNEFFHFKIDQKNLNCTDVYRGYCEILWEGDYHKMNL